MAIGDIHSDGAVVWKEDFVMGLSKLPLVVGYNHTETYQTSGTFTAPITGLYKITLQGGGAGGAGAGTDNHTTHITGGGGGQGGHLVFFEMLTAGTSYSYTVGAGGSGGVAGSSSANAAGGNGGIGGNTTLVVGTHTYAAYGGDVGAGTANGARGGNGGRCYIDGAGVPQTGAPGGSGSYATTNTGGGSGGGSGGGHTIEASGSAVPYGIFGGGGSGGGIKFNNTYYTGGAGGDGYITFEWFDPADVWPSLFPSTP